MQKYTYELQQNIQLRRRAVNQISLGRICHDFLHIHADSIRRYLNPKSAKRTILSEEWVSSYNHATTSLAKA